MPDPRTSPAQEKAHGRRQQTGPATSTTRSATAIPRCASPRSSG